jgi:hypothetical protein
VGANAGRVTAAAATKADTLVLEGAKLCDQIEATLLAMRDDVRQVSFPATDRHHLTAALEAEAASWRRSPTCS